MRFMVEEYPCTIIEGPRLGLNENKMLINAYRSHHGIFERLFSCQGLPLPQNQAHVQNFTGPEPYKIHGTRKGISRDGQSCMEDTLKSDCYLSHFLISIICSRM